jgi:hypothetical protein
MIFPLRYDFAAMEGGKNLAETLLDSGLQDQQVIDWLRYEGYFNE